MEEFFKKISATPNRIRDPLYGFIPLTCAESQILDTPLFQRLRRIHQLALTKYVYPSAEHSRFVHSLGVMHCATLMYSGIFGNKETNIGTEPNATTIKTLRYAAMLHDIGHLPFSHAVEKQWLSGLKHEALSEFIIKNYSPISNIIAADGIDPADVASILGKKYKAKLKLLHEIVSGQLDADRADYLLRDSHCCGVTYGEYDFQRFLQIFAARENDDGQLTLCVDERDLPVAESLLIARYHYNLQIPYHRTRSGYDFVLKRFAHEHTNFSSIFVVQDQEICEVDFEQLVCLDDSSIMQIIKDQYCRGEYWSGYLLRQKHLHAVLDTSNLAPGGADAFKDFVQTIQADTSVVEGEDFFIQDKEIELLAQAQEGSPDSGAAQEGIVRLLVRDGGCSKKKAVDIRDYSWIFGQLKKTPHMLLRVYVKPEKKDDFLGILSSKNGERHV